MNKLKVHFIFWFKFIPLNLFCFLTAPFFSIPAILMRNWKFNLFALWMDDSRYKVDREKGIFHNVPDYDIFANDYAGWLESKGNKESFKNLYFWHGWRNTAWNLRHYFRRKVGDEYLVENIIDKLVFQNNHLEVSDQSGFMRYEQSAGLKWITKDGTQNWWVNSGILISWIYSIIGESKLYFRVNKTLYFRYSKCVLLQGFWKNFWSVVLTVLKFKNMFKKDLWYTFKYGTGRQRDYLSMKVQWEKV